MRCDLDGYGIGHLHNGLADMTGVGAETSDTGRKDVLL